MSWTGARELKAQLARLWERGELLRDAVTGRTRFPLRLSLNAPASNDVTERFEQVRVWATELASIPRIRVQWQQVRHRVQGSQRLPESVWVDSVDDALHWLGRRHDWDRFAALLAATRQAEPALLTWLERRPMQALELADAWQRLLALVQWMRRHPRPGIFLRQVDVPGVHSKFIEAHRAVLTELLDLVLPAEAFDATKTGVTQFSARYGFLDKPLRIRFRVLDARIGPLNEPACPDITLDAESFSRLRLPVRRVFITENETNFLAFPAHTQAIVVFGAGYGWDALSRCRWLLDCDVHYWGDIDTHGFAILDRLRSHFPQVHSLLMDRTTFDAHAGFWGTEEKPTQVDLPRLRSAERDLYDTLRDNRIRPGLRLEQEHIGFGWLNTRLAQLEVKTLTPGPLPG